jgi:hypothetical protein
MQRQRNRGVESNLFHQFLPPSDFLSHCSRFTSDMFNQTIPKQKRPFLGLKVHSFTQNMRPFPYIFVMLLSSNSYRLVTFYINMLMPKLFKHVNCPANFFSAFDKPCIPLKTSIKSLFMSRNDHDKSMTKMYGNGQYIREASGMSSYWQANWNT